MLIVVFVGAALGIGEVIHEQYDTVANRSRVIKEIGKVYDGQVPAIITGLDISVSHPDEKSIEVVMTISHVDAAIEGLLTSLLVACIFVLGH